MFVKNQIPFATRFILILILVTGMLGMNPIIPVYAATLVVTNASDTEVGSLRYMVAMVGPGTGTIKFDPSLAGQTITLSFDLLFRWGDVTIDGSGLSPQITISGGNVAHLETQASAKLAISNLIITDGNGGAIVSNGAGLTLTNVTLKNNHSDGSGGAVSINGIGSSLIDNCTFLQNQANGDGGAVSIGGSSDSIISDSTFTQNQAGGDGGAIFAGGLLSIRSTTISQNKALYSGGAIANIGFGHSIIVNSTITQNQSTTGKGGAIFMNGGAENQIFNSTFAENEAPNGSELYLGGETLLYAYNTIFACLPGASTCYSQTGAPILSLTNSIMDTGTLADFGLAELADNGGPTQTMALYGNSPLINAGDDTVCANAVVNNLDQRGVTRPKGTHCDIGAYESDKIFYVKQDATGANNGTSWANAYTDLQSALAAASSGNEIWVAAGTYKPTTGIDRNIFFMLKNVVALYGGFAGSENVRTQRNSSTNVTILSGDIGVAGVTTDNSLNVVIGSNLNNSAILDGFTITAGNANSALASGGGMYNTNSSPTLTNLLFINNSAVTSGGGIFNINGSSPKLTNVTFQGNSASSGGAMENEINSSPSLENVTFTNNSADLGGGITNANNCSPTLVNVTFTNNTAIYGGGMVNRSSTDNPILTNVTFSNNSASSAGGAIANSGNPVIRNSILWGDTGGEIQNIAPAIPVISNSIVQGGYAGTENLNVDPLLSPLANHGGITQTMALAVGSPAIDSGNDSFCPATDQRGVHRPVGSHCDMGAFEFNPRTIYVKYNATGLNDGTSWANAYTDLQSALATALSGDEIWVAAGTYKPTIGTDRTISFTLKSGVAIYGGFAGSETSRAQRDFAANSTVLSGDIGAAGVKTDNSYHVVIGSNTNNATILDGFTITGGNVEFNAPLYYGGGIYSYLGNFALSNLIIKDNTAIYGGGMFSEGRASDSIAHPILTNVAFINNNAIGDGGGMGNNNYSQPTLTNVAFIGNTSNHAGGGMNNLTHCDAILTNVTFNGNLAANLGGGLANDSNLTLTNVAFSNNISNDVAGGMFNYGPSSITLTNVTFNGNSAASFGGAIVNMSNATSSLTHVTISGNSAATYGDGIYNSSSNLTIRNSILYDNEEEIYGSATVTYSVVQGGYAGTGNLDVNPLLNPLADNGGFTQTMALSTDSPAIDAGNDSNCPATDQRGVTRPQGSHCDIGAYEYYGIINPTPTATPVITITPSTPSPTPIPTTSTPAATATSSTQIPLTSGIYDDAHPSITYNDWIGITDLMAYQGTLHISNTAGSLMTFKFTGQQFGFTYQGNASLGVIRINIDGLNLDLDQSNGVNEWISPQLATGTYTVTIQHTSGGSVNIDSVIIPDGSTDTPTITPTVPPTNTPAPTPSYTPTPTSTHQHSYLKSEALTPVSLITQFGTTSGSLASLSLLDQSGAEDNPEAYVSFQTPNTLYVGYQSFTLPSDAQAKLISTMILQVNFKGPAASTQVWTWSVYDWSTRLWIKIGNSMGMTPEEWQTLVFRIRQPWRYVSSGKEIRIQLQSNNANADAEIDYEALHITYFSIPATPTPVIPVVVPNRPGLFSVPSTPRP